MERPHKLNFVETLESWTNVTKIYNGHVFCLPNIKNVVNCTCLRGNRDEMLNLYVCLCNIRNVVSDVEKCGDSQDYECKLCNKKDAFLRSLTLHIFKIKRALNNSQRIMMRHVE